MTDWTPKEFCDKFVIPGLVAIGLYSKAAERLVLGTAMVESNLRYVSQKGGGPALGYFQMETPTHDWLFQKFCGPVRYQTIFDGLKKISDRPGYAIELRDNPVYAAAMCRLRYFAVSKPLPDENNLQAIGQYWKTFYNTELGAGTLKAFMDRASGCMAV